MILFKNNADTLEQVIVNSKHASNSIPTKAKQGDIILIAQTRKTLKNNEKSIRYIMRYNSLYEDTKNESEKLWGKSWKYIIEGYGLQPVEPFDIKDIQISKHNYGAVMTHCSLLEEDEEAVLDWIFSDKTEINSYIDEIKKDNNNDIYGLEFNNSIIDDYQLLAKIDAEFINAPDYKEKVIKYLHRPSSIRNAVIRVKGTKCQICGYEGFLKKNSNVNYCEVHHMIELNKNAPKTLQSWNLIVVCPTCHKRLHYGNVSSKLNSDNRWEISLDDNKVFL